MESEKLLEIVQKISYINNLSCEEADILICSVVSNLAALINNEEVKQELQETALRLGNVLIKQVAESNELEVQRQIEVTVSKVQQLTLKGKVVFSIWPPPDPEG